MADEPRVIDFAAKKRELTLKGARRHISFRLDKDGCLQIDQKNSRDVVVESWTFPQRESDNVITLLYQQLGRWRTERYFAQHPEARPKPKQEKPRDPRNRRCRLTPKGYVGRGGCRRRTGHDGDHHVGSRTWSAPYPHHRFCGSFITAEQAKQTFGPTAKLVEIDHSLVGEITRTFGGEKEASHFVVVDGRCARCFFRYGPSAT